ncbi:MAG TPA: tryptophan synthase subunit alpha [Fimbriimonas sp.]|nr:tryptophan synthase subunit alpha [Fimbriimonas sp.]
MTLEQKFTELKASGGKALVCFLTAGDQPLSDLPAIISLLAESGADVVEVGIPFSDPFGEGPTIQASSQRALDNGANVRTILDAIAKCDVNIPIVTMGYYNPMLRMGLEDFARASKRAGVTGTIVSDLVPDEADSWNTACLETELETVYLVAPTSTDERISQVAGMTTGFVYVVSRTGVTGTESSVPTDVQGLVAKVKSLTSKPACVGFGISTPEHVRMVCQVADGAVVGSSLVKMLHENWGTPSGSEKIREYVSSLKEATRRS